MTRLTKLLISLAGLAMIAMPAQAYEKGDWILRVGAGMVDPDSPVYSDSADDISAVVDSATSLVFNGTYMMSRNWGFEILAAAPFSHDVKVGPADLSSTVKIGEVKQIPPTFSFQYHFLPDGTFRPYAGLGLNYTMFYDETIDQAVFPGASLSVDNSFGVAAQLGADIGLGEKWLLNFDFRYISIAPKATLFDGTESDTVTLDINPFVYSLTVGYRF